MQRVSSYRSFGGEQNQYTHSSEVCGCTMTVSVYLPPKDGPVPVWWWLSGLTCTDQNFVTKAGAQRVAAELGVAIVAPDTSPRGPDVPGDPDGAWDFGLGAGYYLDATEAPYARNYQMARYLTDELPRVLAELPLDFSRQGISGHSMGGHGALVLALRNPGRFRSVSAFSPIVAPTQVPWGQKAFPRFLGSDPAAWRAWDTVALIPGAAERLPLLVDQGTADSFLANQLRPELLAEVCAANGHPLTLRMQEGYDHSYYFVASFLEDHLRWFARSL
jgi:S-formylglutathione hydrolase